MHTIEEAAEQLGCTPRWYADQLRAGRFPGHKIGGKWRLSGQDIEDARIICRTAPASFRDNIHTKNSMTPTSRRRLRA
jgi:excisionase family DNA binding protein